MATPTANTWKSCFGAPHVQPRIWHFKHLGSSKCSPTLNLYTVTGCLPCFSFFTSFSFYAFLVLIARVRISPNTQSNKIASEASATAHWPHHVPLLNLGEVWITVKEQYAGVALHLDVFHTIHEGWTLEGPGAKKPWGKKELNNQSWTRRESE